MLIFSASKATRETKKFYKDFFEVQEDIQNLREYVKHYAISSYLYSSGQTETNPAEQCEGHRAWRSVCGRGNVLLFDFDSKITKVTLDDLKDKLKDVSCYITISKNWSQELEKYHVIIELDELVPDSREDFKTLYRAAAQYLRLEGLYDAAMESATQQMSPHFRESDLDLCIKAAPLSVSTVLDAYKPLENHSCTSSNSLFAGYVEEDTIFTLSRTKQQVNVEQIKELVRRSGKQRVHCIAGLEHDGRRDTAFVNLSDGRYLYACSGGRCSHTLELRDSPFSKQAEQTTVETRKETLQNIIASHTVFRRVYKDEKVKNELIEAAVNYAITYTRERDRVTQVEGALRKYNGVYWQEVFKHKSDLYTYVQECMIEAGFYEHAYRNASLNNSYNVYKNLVPVRELSEQGNYLNLKNCVLEINKNGVHVHKHNEDYLFTSVLDYDYDPAAQCDNWNTIVRRVMCDDDDTIDAFQQALGYLLLREFNLEKMVCFVGEGENGKSTILRVIKKLVGKSGYSAQPLKTLLALGSEGHYARAQLAGKLINITNELTPASLEADAFKDIISGEDIIARNIYEAPFVLSTVPKQLVAMNKTDHLIRERTHGFMRRLLLIPFNYKLLDEHKDEHINEKLESEMSGILNWMLAGAQKVIKNGKIIESSLMKELLENVKRDSNPVQQYVEENLVADNSELCYETECLSSNEIFANFIEFCEANNYKRWGRNKFLSELTRLNIVKVDTTKIKPGLKPRKIRGYRAEFKKHA